MPFKHGHGFLTSVFLLLLHVVAKVDQTSWRPMDAVTRSNFSNGFVFGSSSAAYQYEGAAFEDGKGPSIWDNYTHQHPEKIYDMSNGDVALDQYHRYKEDVAIMKKIGFDAYRFSISWTRVLPSNIL